MGQRTQRTTSGFIVERGRGFIDTSKASALLKVSIDLETSGCLLLSQVTHIKEMLAVPLNTEQNNG
jgi:hypothetical protein